MKVFCAAAIAELVLLTAAASSALAADGLALPQTGVVPASAGIAIKAPGINSAAQFVIPRYRFGTNFPAGQIVGFGPASMLVGTADTQNRPVKAIVITQDFGEKVSQWQLTSAGYLPAVLQPKLSDVTIAGYSADNWATGGLVADGPQVHNQDAPYLYNGANMSGNGGEIHNVEFFYIPGVALDVTRNGTIAVGAQLPFDRLRWTVDRICSHRVYAGPWIRATDSSCSDVETFGFRDYGFRLGDSRSGAIQSHIVHCYGGGYSDEPNGSGGAAIWVSGDGCQCDQYYGENAPIGLLISGNSNSVNQIRSHTCRTTNIKITGRQDVVTDLNVDATVIGVSIEDQYNTIRDGWIHPKGKGKAIVLENGTAQVIDIGIGAFGQPDAIGIEAHTQLVNCRITAHIIGGATGIDLDYGDVDRVGDGTVIHITTTKETTTPAKLHKGWSTTPTNTKKEVVINGTRYYPP